LPAQVSPMMILVVAAVCFTIIFILLAVFLFFCFRYRTSSCQTTGDTKLLLSTKVSKSPSMLLPPHAMRPLCIPPEVQPVPRSFPNSLSFHSINGSLRNLDTR
ncbi:hypothetical protein Ciccas_013787, partial [Cichlidogyrus casuarinus]